MPDQPNRRSYAVVQYTNWNYLRVMRNPTLGSPLPTSHQILCLPRWAPLERHPLCSQLVLF